MNGSYELAPGRMLSVRSNGYAIVFEVTENGLPVTRLAIPRRIYKRIIAAYVREWVDILFPEDDHEP